VTGRRTGWYWLPAEPGEKVNWHPAFYDAERGRMWVAQCSGSGWAPREGDLARPAASLAEAPEPTRRSS
jgi:hypothetical protein